MVGNLKEPGCEQVVGNQPAQRNESADEQSSTVSEAAKVQTQTMRSEYCIVGHGLAAGVRSSTMEEQLRTGIDTFAGYMNQRLCLDGVSGCWQE
jgi:hypothetical protein